MGPDLKRGFDDELLMFSSLGLAASGRFDPVQESA
jgi:hypothetical protein